MFVGLVRIVLAVPAQGRAVTQKLRDKISRRFHASVSEVEPNTPSGRAVIGVAIVAPYEQKAAELSQAVLDFVHQDGDAAVVDSASEVLSFDDVAIMDEPTLAEKEGLKRDWDPHDHADARKQARLAELRRARKEREE